MKQQGEVVTFRHNQITIKGVCYNIENYEEIPAKYLNAGKKSDQDSDQAVSSDEPMEAAGGVPVHATKEGVIRKGERMRVTSKGLVFSGPGAYLSNMAYIPITFNNQDFDSNEQGYQWNKAIGHNDPDLAKEIKKTDNSYEVKTTSGLVTASTEWKASAPDLLEQLFEAKLDSWNV